MSASIRYRFATLVSLGVLAIPAWPLASAADGPADKAGRGIAGLVAPFLEIPGNIVTTAEREGGAEAWTEGLARGLGMSLIRPPFGFYELVTAPFAIPPTGYDPLLEPEYPWSYFTREGVEEGGLSDELAGG